MADSGQITALLVAIAKAIHQNRDELTRLDAAIGDGDHGHNLDRGFTAVVERLTTTADADLGRLFQQTGMTLIATVGGASGPLYGTAFLRMGGILTGRTEVSLADLPNLMEAAIGGIQQRGRAVTGEKTMLDALVPAHQALLAALAEGITTPEALARTAQAAEDGAAATAQIRATKGRASYLGERSIGHPDPGATSTALILRQLHSFFAGG